MGFDAKIIIYTVFFAIGLSSLGTVNDAYSANQANPVSLSVPDFNGHLNVDVNLLNADEDVTDETGNDIDMSNFRFRVDADIPSNPKIFEGSEGVTRESFDVFFTGSGAYKILVEFIERDDEGNEIDSTDITNDDGVIRSDGCASTINIGENRACAIQIDVDDISGVSTESGEVTASGFVSNEVDEVNENTDLIPENAVIEAESGVIGTSIDQGVLPIDVCITQEKPTVRVKPGPGGGTETVNIKLMPISATYNFQGTASMDKIRDLLGEGDIGLNPISTGKGKQIIFEIQFDNNKDDQVHLTPVNSFLKGKIYTKLFPFNSDDAGFELKKIWTDCYYPSIYEAGTKYFDSEESQSTDTRLVPIGDDKETPSKEVDLPVQGEDRSFTYATRNSGLQPLGEKGNGALINPPFSVCANVLGSNSLTSAGKFDISDSDTILANKENVISKYMIRSIVDKSDFDNGENEATLLLRVIVDTVPNDHALIGDNSNNVLKAQLVINPQQHDVDIIDLSIQEVSTDCIDVSYSDSFVQDL